MPKRTKKKRQSHHSFVQYNFPARPTLKEHGFRIKSHHVPNRRQPSSVKTVYRSIRNLIRPNNQSSVRMNVSVKQRPSLARSAKSKYQSERQEKKLQKQMLNTIKEEKKKKEKSHKQEMNELNRMMKSMGF